MEVTVPATVEFVQLFHQLSSICSRNHVPWGVITATNFSSAVALLVLRYLYLRENKRRDLETRDDTYDAAYIKTDSGESRKVDKASLPYGSHPHGVNYCPQAFLDLTDKQNRDFRYVL